MQPQPQIRRSTSPLLRKGGLGGLHQRGFRISDFGFRIWKSTRGLSTNGARQRQIRNPKSKIRNYHTSFTLVELMVVITIIAILATIALGVVGGLIGQARAGATKATISKIQGLLRSRSQAFDRLVKRKGYLTGTQEYQWVVQYYGAALPQQSSRQMLATKLLQAKFFPQR